jgi:geranylgeranyl reductase family protein
VLLLDRAEFPRDKPCGGGVNIRSARLLPFDLGPIAERVIYGLRVSVRQGHAFERVSSQPLSLLTQRRHLDAHLVQRAVAVGARFQDGTGVRAVERENGHLVLRAGRDSFRGRVLVAADGGNGPVARLAGIDARRHMGIALEGNVTADPFPEWWEQMLGIDVGSAPGGYSWLFPKGNHVNIGVGGWYHIGPSLRARLHAMTLFYGFDPHQLWGVRGHPLPIRLPGSPLVDGNVLLVGDAAGLLDPLTGEGIFAAIWSGRAAARHIARYLAGETTTLDGYRRDVAAELLPDLEVCTQLHFLFHAMPPAWAQLVRRSTRAWRLVASLMTGDFTYSAIRRRSRALAMGIDVTSSGVRLAARLRHHPALDPA